MILLQSFFFFPNNFYYRSILLRLQRGGKMCAIKSTETRYFPLCNISMSNLTGLLSFFLFAFCFTPVQLNVHVFCFTLRPFDVALAPQTGGCLYRERSKKDEARVFWRITARKLRWTTYLLFQLNRHRAFRKVIVLSAADTLFFLSN